MKFASVFLVLAALSIVTANGKTSNYRTVTTDAGDKISILNAEQEQVSVTNKATGAKEVRTFDKVSERPLTLNGKEIAHDTKLVPQIEQASIKLQEQIGEGLKEAIDKLSEGSYKYTLADVVVDEQGRVVYYTTEGIKDAGIKDFCSYAAEFHNISDQERKLMAEAIDKALCAVKIEPLIIDGEAVPFTLDIRSTFLN